MALLTSAVTLSPLSLSRSWAPLPPSRHIHAIRVCARVYCRVQPRKLNFGRFTPTAYVPQPEDLEGMLPLHLAARRYNKSEAVIKALLDAYPDAAKEKDKVRYGRRWTVFPFRSSCMCVCVAVCRGRICRSTLPPCTTTQRR